MQVQPNPSWTSYSHKWKRGPINYGPASQVANTYTFTHTDIYIYIYVYCTHTFTFPSPWQTHSVQKVPTTSCYAQAVSINDTTIWQPPLVDVWLHELPMYRILESWQDVSCWLWIQKGLLLKLQIWTIWMPLVRKHLRFWINDFDPITQLKSENHSLMTMWSNC